MQVLYKQEDVKNQQKLRTSGEFLTKKKHRQAITGNM